MNLLGGNPVTQEVAVFAIFVGVLVLAEAVVFVLRTRSLPVCGHCGFSSVRRVHSRHRPLDTIARACLLYPHRCQRCLHRFYCFGSPRVHRTSSNNTMTAAAK